MNPQKGKYEEHHRWENGLVKIRINELPQWPVVNMKFRTSTVWFSTESRRTKMYILLLLFDERKDGDMSQNTTIISYISRDISFHRKNRNTEIPLSHSSCPELEITIGRNEKHENSWKKLGTKQMNAIGWETPKNHNWTNEQMDIIHLNWELRQMKYDKQNDFDQGN